MNNFDSQLLADNFDVIQFLNNLFPTEESVGNISNVLQKVENEIENFDSDVKESVRAYSSLSTKSQKVIEETSTSIDEIVDVINELNDKANHTQKTVVDMCGSIKSYDNAKSNLTESITCLKRLQMASFAVKDLEFMVSQGNYSECADRILALTTLLEYFKNFDSNSLLDDIKTRFDALKNKVEQMVKTDIDQKLFSPIVDSSVAPACLVIEALGDEYKNKTITLFCNKFLEPYVKEFKNTPLKQTEQRYNWLKQAMEKFKDSYSKIFPQKWRMPYHISISFCAITKSHIQNILSGKQINQGDFSLGFEQTAAFERVLAESFGSNIINEKGETEWKPESIFIGLIGGAFSSNTELYLDSVRANLKSYVIKAAQQRKIDSENKIFMASINLVQYMNNIIQKCTGFNNSMVLYQLFFVLRDPIIDYADSIFKLKPQTVRNKDLELWCTTVNTMQYFRSILSGLVKRIQSQITGDLAQGVRIDDIADRLGDNIGRLIRELCDMICNDYCSSGFQSIQSGNWMTCPDAQCQIAEQIIMGLNQSIPAVKKYMTDESFSSFRDQFIIIFINNYYSISFGRTFVGYANERLTSATDKIEKTIVGLVNVPRGSSKEKFIFEQFGKVRLGLRMMIFDPVTMPDMYIQIAKKPNTEEFKIFLAAKGVKPNDPSYKQIMQRLNELMKQK